MLPSHQSDPTASTNHIDGLKPGKTLMKEEFKNNERTEEKNGRKELKKNGIHRGAG
jgi:hypothetical protein